MNRRELVNAIAAHTGKEPREVDAYLKGFTEVVTATVAKGEPVARPSAVVLFGASTSRLCFHDW